MACCNSRDALILCVLHGLVPLFARDSCNRRVCSDSQSTSELCWSSLHTKGCCTPSPDTPPSFPLPPHHLEKVTKARPNLFAKLELCVRLPPASRLSTSGSLAIFCEGERRGESRAQTNHLCLSDLGDGVIKCLNWNETTANTTQAPRCFCGTHKCCHVVRCCSCFVVPLIKILTV